jgi:hypothetical protein
MQIRSSPKKRRRPLVIFLLLLHFDLDAALILSDGMGAVDTEVE